MSIIEWLDERIKEIDYSIEYHQKHDIEYYEKIISENTRGWGLDEVDDTAREVADKTKRIYEHVINDFLIPTKHNLEFLKESELIQKNKDEEIE